MKLTGEQQTRTSLLLIGSESPTAFVQHCLVKKEGAVMGAAEMYEKYQEWCGKQELPPFSGKEFHKIAKPKIEIKWGLKYRHDLKDEDGKCTRGWKGLALVEDKELRDVKMASKESDIEIVESV